jgi:hypothetical protein
VLEVLIDVELGIEQGQAEERRVVLPGLPVVVFTDELPVNEAVASI